MYIGGKQRGRFRCLLRKRSSKDRIPVAEPSEKNTEKKSEAEHCALAKWFQITCPVTGHLVVSALKTSKKDGKVTGPEHRNTEQ